MWVHDDTAAICLLKRRRDGKDGEQVGSPLGSSSV